ncbi:hypothetical protein ACS0TY_020073 [Phlomoides rotata]
MRFLVWSFPISSLTLIAGRSRLSCAIPRRKSIFLADFEKEEVDLDNSDEEMMVVVHGDSASGAAMIGSVIPGSE